MMEFLYFPEDKTEYIPAVIMLVIFMIGAVVAMYFFLKASKKEAKKADEMFQSKNISNKTDDKKI